MRMRVGCAVAVAVLLLSAACTNPEPTELPASAVRVSGEQVEVLAREHSSGVTQRRREVLRSSAELAAAWSEMYSIHHPKPPVPAVDFSRSVVVLAAMGTRPGGGFLIDIEDVYRAGADVHVVVRETSPGGKCGVTAALSNPVVLVRVEAGEGAVKFIERPAFHECT